MHSQSSSSSRQRFVSVAGASGVQSKNPWYAYDAAARKAHAQTVRSIEPTSPWYAYDAAQRKARHQRQQQRVGYQFHTDTLGGSGGAITNKPN